MWRLHVDGLVQMDAHAGHGPRDDDLRSVRETYLADGGEFLVGAVDGEVVAIGAIRRRSEEIGEIKRMRVDPRCQRQGFGRALLRALEARAGELGYRVLRLDTAARMIPAQGLYRSSGYRESGRGPYPTGQEAVFFEKRLVRMPKVGGAKWA